ncbi:MAG: hypothetical protein WBA12_07325 [Catalinimonas sp.]
MRIFKIVLIVVGVALLGLLAYALFGNYSSGSRGGTVAKFSRKGVLFKTYEGQLNVGAFTNREGGFAPEIWDFSVVGGNDEVREALEAALLEGYRVKLYYYERFLRFFWMGDTKYFVHRVELVQRPAEAPRTTPANEGAVMTP